VLKKEIITSIIYIKYQIFKIEYTNNYNLQNKIYLTKYIFSIDKDFSLRTHRNYVLIQDAI